MGILLRLLARTASLPASAGGQRKAAARARPLAGGGRLQAGVMGLAPFSGGAGQAWWLYALAGLALAGVVFVIMRLRERRLRRRQEHLEREVEERTRELRQQQNMMHSIIDRIPQAIFVKDTQSRFRIANTYIADRMGAGDPSELIGKTDFDFYEDELARQFYESEQAILESGESQINKEERGVELSTGRPRYTLSTKVPVYDDDGTPRYLVCANVDITERHRAEMRLKHQQHLLRAIIDHIPHDIYVKDEDGRFLVANASVAKRAGYDDPDAVVGKTDFDLYPRKRAEEHRRDEEAILASGEPQIEKEERERDAEGRERWTLSTKVPIEDKDGAVRLVGIAYDITERRRFEARVERQQTLLRAIVDHIPEPIWVKDTESRFLVANEYVAQKMGASGPDELLGKTDFDYFEEAKAREFYQDEQRILETGQAQFGKEEQSLHVSSGEMHHMLSTKVPVRDADGEIAYIAGMSFNITERKQLQEQLIEARDRAEEAARAKSAFLANMSHEIRTPMNGVIGMTSLLADTPLSDEQKEFVEVIRNSGEALLSIINDILDFSKIEAGKITLEEQPFAVHGVVESALDLVRSDAAEKELDVAYFVDETVPTALRGDVTRLRQILINLLSNAVKFTEEGQVSVQVSARCLAEGEQATGDVVEMPPPGTPYEVRFAVRDTGIGISDEQRERLFDSFNQADVSTTREYGGTGLGLAISRRLAERMGGTMELESEVGHGSTFAFTIQAEAAEPLDETQPLFKSHAELDGRPLLVVDDNGTNRRMMQLQTERWGMEPTMAASGAEGLRRMREAEAAGRPFALVLLDMHMPGMDGLELAHHLAARHPGAARVMFSSAGHRPAPEEAPLDAWLPKPSKAAHLLRVFKDVMTNTPAPRATQPDSRLDSGLAERHPLRILLAEDNRVNQKVALRVLERLGYSADVVANGREVLEATERQHYDLILMDIQMPELDGLGTARRLCERDGDAQRPHLVAVTADVTEEGRAACYAAGFEDHLGKPFSARALADAITDCTPREAYPRPLA